MHASKAQLDQTAITAFRRLKHESSLTERKTLFYKGWSIVVNGPVSLHVQYSVQGKDYVYIIEL